MEKRCIDARSTHRRKKNAKVAQKIAVEHVMTARVCSLRFLGILDGTNLPHTQPPTVHSAHIADRCADVNFTKASSQGGAQTRDMAWSAITESERQDTHSMCACRLLTGLRGVAMRLLRLLRRSRSKDDGTVRVADVTTIVPANGRPPGISDFHVVECWTRIGRR